MTQTIMFYVYFIRNEKNQDIYIGSCLNVEVRVLRHNQGRVRSTKGNRPWKLLGFEEFETRAGAVRSEKLYKSLEQRKALKERFKDL